MRVGILGVLAVVVGVVPPALAQSRIGSDFQVNTWTTNSQAFPRVAVDANGNFVVVWQSGLVDGSYLGIAGQRFAADGTSLGTEFQVNTYSTGTQQYPAIAVNGDGRFVVVWQSGQDGALQDGSGWAVRGRRFDATGTAVGDEFQVNTYTTDDQIRPAVVVTATGFVVVWQSKNQYGTGWQLIGRHFDWSGAVSTEFDITAGTSSEAMQPALAPTRTGFVVTWTRGNGYDSAARHLEDGTFLPPEIPFHPDAAGDKGPPSVATDLSPVPSSGNFVVVLPGYEISTQRFNSYGHPLGGIQVNTYYTGVQAWPSVSMAPAGDFVVAWVSDSQDGDGWGIFGQELAPDGTRRGSEFQVNTYTTGNQVHPSVALTPGGGFVVVWDDFNRDGESNGIFGQRFSLNVTPTATPTTPPPTPTPTHIALPTGFREEFVAGGISTTPPLTNVTAMAFAPDGRLFVCDKGGAVRVITAAGVLLSTPFATLNVSSQGERGLLGIAVDPAFATNHYVYVYYTATSPIIHNSVSRLVANGDVAIAQSELLDVDSYEAYLTSWDIHNGGALHFDATGKLLIATGDRGFYPQNSQMGTKPGDATNLVGKILRMDPYFPAVMPTDNPFYGTATGNNQLIWAYGLRNPFTFDVQPGTGRVFINDVGQNSWEEINDGIAGANYGWPQTEGYLTPPQQAQYPEMRGPIYAYGHTPECAIVGGTFYNPAVVSFPAAYLGQYFFADLCANWIRVLDPASGNAVSDFATSATAGIVDLKTGPEGALYYLTQGGQVRRILFGTPTATPIPTSSPTATATSTLTSTPTVTASPTVTATPTPTTVPAIAIDRTHLNYGITRKTLGSGNIVIYPMTDPQVVHLTVPGLSWMATSDQAFLDVTPASGTGSAAVTLMAHPWPNVPIVGPAPLAHITVSAPGASNSPQVITAQIVSYEEGTALPPFGSFDTPQDSASGLHGAIPVTGWALDVIGVARVEVYRDPVTADAPAAIGAHGKVFLGIATLVSDARPDVDALYPWAPLSYRAAWGYMLLSNFLPSGSNPVGGNGSFTLYAYAMDVEGNTTLLGSKTTAIDNASATQPFGTIDTPPQGGNVSGLLDNFGWVLTPGTATIPTDGSTIQVFVDGVFRGTAQYNLPRNDIQTLFPGYTNSSGPVGYFQVDTTTLGNGVHTIFWIVTDDQNHADGIGSRYFSVLN